MLVSYQHFGSPLQGWLNLEDGADGLSRNVRKKLAFCALYNPKTAPTSFTPRRKPAVMVTERNWVRHPAATHKTYRQTVRQAVCEQHFTVLWAASFGFNCKLSSDTDKNMWRKYTHLQHIIVKPDDISTSVFTKACTAYKTEQHMAKINTYKRYCSESVEYLVRVIPLCVCVCVWERER